MQEKGEEVSDAKGGEKKQTAVAAAGAEKNQECEGVRERQKGRALLLQVFSPLLPPPSILTEGPLHHSR